MPFSASVKARIDKAIGSSPTEYGALQEKAMFGGICYMYKGYMTVGILKDELTVRLGPVLGPEALKEPYTRPMEFTKTPMTSIITVEEPGFKTAKQLNGWLQRSMSFVDTLPAKGPGPQSKRPSTASKGKGKGKAKAKAAKGKGKGKAKGKGKGKVKPEADAASARPAKRPRVSSKLS